MFGALFLIIQPEGIDFIQNRQKNNEMAYNWRIKWMIYEIEKF